MKKLLIIIVAILCMTVTVQAQEKGDMAAGVHFALGTGDSFTNMGVGAKFQWNVINKLRLEPSFTYFFKKDYLSMWDISANVHYQFVLSDIVNLYPLAGLSVMGVKASIPTFDLGEYGSYGGSSASDTEFGFNIGAGADFKVSEKIIVNAELKYKIGGNWNRFIIGAGVAYRF